MKKIIQLTLVIIAISGCSSKTYYQYQNNEERKNISVKKDKINIRNFDLKLFETRLGGRISAQNIDSEFLDTKEMKELMLNSINNSLKENGYSDSSNNSYQYDLKIVASRVFSAFSSNKYVGLNIEDVRINVYKNGNFIAQKHLRGSEPSIIQTGPVIDCGSNRGLIGNLATISKTILHIKNAKDEIDDTKRCSKAIYNAIILLGN